MEHGEEKPDPLGRPKSDGHSLIDAEVGPYRIVEKLGEGGMGVVYKAVGKDVEHVVALKILFEVDDPANVKRFLQEAKALAKLAHPNIIRFLWIGEHKGYPCFAMEYISEGVSVYDLLKDKGVLPLDPSVDIVIQAAKGLSAARRAGIVHRDVKPNNLLIDADGTVKISDFGLAKIVEGDGHLTQSGIVMGTPYYMSPEQGQGEAIDHRSDLYSLGATFYHMITGHTPYEAQNPVSLIIKHVKEPLPDIRSLNPEVPDAIRRITETCLEKDPADRYQEYEELIEDLEAWQKGQQPVNAPEVRPRRSASSRMPPWVWFVLGLTIAGAGAGAAKLVPWHGTTAPTAVPTATIAIATSRPVPTPTPATPEPGELDRALADASAADPLSRAHAAVTLGKLAAPEGLGALSSLASPAELDASVRARAVWALGRLPVTEQRNSALIAALHDQDPVIVLLAIAGLDGAQDVRSVEPLQELAQHHPDPRVARAASNAAEKMSDVDTDQSFGGHLGSWWRSEFRVQADALASAKAREDEADRAVRWYRQKWGFTAKAQVPATDPERRIYLTVYAAALRAQSQAEAEVRDLDSKQQALVSSADAAQVPPGFRR